MSTNVSNMKEPFEDGNMDQKKKITFVKNVMEALATEGHC